MILGICLLLGFQVEVARGWLCRLEAAAILTSLPPNHAVAELSIAPPSGGHESMVAELLDLAVDLAARRYRRLIVSRERANPDLRALLLENQGARLGCDNIEIHLDIRRWRTSAGVQSNMQRAQ
jgi:hypothetical protein